MRVCLRVLGCLGLQVSGRVVIKGPTVFSGDADARQAAEVNPQTFAQWRRALPMSQRMHTVRYTLGGLGWFGSWLGGYLTRAMCSMVKVYRPVASVKLTFAARNLDFSGVNGGNDPKPLLVVSRIAEGSCNEAVVVAQSVSIQARGACWQACH